MADSDGDQRNPFDLFSPRTMREPEPVIDDGGGLPELMQPGASLPPVGKIDQFLLREESELRDEPLEPPAQSAAATCDLPSTAGEDGGEFADFPPHAGVAAEGRATEAVTEPATASIPESSVGAAEPEAAATGPGAPPESHAPRPPLPLDQRKLWVLRILLVSNVALMALMLMLPHPLEPRQEYRPGELGGSTRNTESSGSREIDPFAPPARAGELALPDDAAYENALRLGASGDFAGAAAELEAMLTAEPDLNPAVARLLHSQLGYYLRKAGQLGSAMEHEALARQEGDRATFPEELLQRAREAELRGDGAAMRSAYAQFLLQEGQLSPEMRALIPEALLKLADSYRVMAREGESPVEERSR